MTPALERMDEAILVLGCQRSGTTLLRLMLGSHPDVASIDEAIAYPVLAGRRELDPMRGSDGRSAARVSFKIPRLTEQLLEDDVRDETYGRLQQFYRGQRSVFLVRDPRDVVASMCALSAGDASTWIATYGRAMLEHRERERAAFAARYADELRRLREREWPPHLVGAMYWRVKNDCLPAYIAAGLPVLPLRYEHLVSAPEQQMRRVLTHLELAWDPAVLRHHEVRHGQLDATGLAIGDSDPTRAIDARSVGRFGSTMTDVVVDEVLDWARPTVDRLRDLCF